MQLPRTYDISSGTSCNEGPSFETEVSTILRLHGCHKATITVAKSAITIELNGTSTAPLPATKWARQHDSLPTLLHPDPHPDPMPQPKSNPQHPLSSTPAANPVMGDVALKPGSLPEGFSYTLKLNIRGQDELQQLAMTQVTASGRCSACGSSSGDGSSVGDAVQFVQQHSTHNAAWAEHIQQQQADQDQNIQQQQQADQDQNIQQQQQDEQDQNIQQQQQTPNTPQAPSSSDCYNMRSHLNIQVAAALVIIECAQHILRKPLSRSSRRCKIRELAASILRSVHLARILAQYCRPSVACIQRAFADRGCVHLWSCIGAAPHDHDAVLLHKKNMAAEARSLVALLRSGQQQQQGAADQQQQQQQRLINPVLREKVTKQQLIAALQQLLQLYQYSSITSAAAAADPEPQQQQQVVIDERFITKWLAFRNLDVSDVLKAANSGCIDSSIDYCMICGNSNGQADALITCDYCCHCFHIPCAVEQGMPATAVFAAKKLLAAYDESASEPAAAAAAAEEEESDQKIYCLSCMGYPCTETAASPAAADEDSPAAFEVLHVYSDDDNEPAALHCAVASPPAAFPTAAAMQPTSKLNLMCTKGFNGCKQLKKSNAALLRSVEAKMEQQVENAARSTPPPAAAAAAAAQGRCDGAADACAMEDPPTAWLTPAAAAAAQGGCDGSADADAMEDLPAARSTAAAAAAAVDSDGKQESGSESEVTDDGEDPAAAAAAVAVAVAVNAYDSRPHAVQPPVLGHCDQMVVNTAVQAAVAELEPAPRAVAAAVDWEQQQAANMSYDPKILHGRDLNTHHHGTKQQLLPQKRKKPVSNSQEGLTAAAAAAVPSGNVLPDHRPHKHHLLVAPQQQQQQQQCPQAGTQAAPTAAQLEGVPGAHTAAAATSQQQHDLLALRWRVVSMKRTPLYDQLQQLAADPQHWPVLQKVLDFWTNAQGSPAAAGSSSSSTEAARLTSRTTKSSSRWEWQGLIDYGIPDLVLDLYKDLVLARSAGICGPGITVEQAEQLLLLPCLAAVTAVFAAGPSSSSSRIKGGTSMLVGTAEAADLATAAAVEQQQPRSREDDSIQMKKVLGREMLLLCKLVMAAVTTGSASADQCNLTAAMLAAAAAGTGAGSGSTVEELDDLAALCWHLRTQGSRPGMLWQQYKQQQQQQQHGKGQSADVTMSDSTDIADASQTWSLLWQLVSKQTLSNQQQQEQGIREFTAAAAAAAMRGISLHALQQLLALLAKAAAAGGCAIANVLNALDSKQGISRTVSLLAAMLEVLATAIRLQVRIVPALGDLEQPTQQQQLQQQQQEEEEEGDDTDDALSAVVQQQQQQAVNELLPAYTDVLIKGLALAAKLPSLSQQQQQQQVGTSAITGLISKVTALSREVLGIVLLPREKLTKVLSCVCQNGCDVTETTQDVLDDVLALVTGALSALSEVDHSPHLAGDGQPSSKKNLGGHVLGLQGPQGVKGVTAEGWERKFELVGAECREVSKLLADTLATLCQ